MVQGANLIAGTFQRNKSPITHAGPEQYLNIRGHYFTGDKFNFL